MHQDVVDLAAFYQSPLGQVATRMIGRRARRLWPDVRGAALLGLGFATPFLAPFRGRRSVCWRRCRRSRASRPGRTAAPAG